MFLTLLCLDLKLQQSPVAMLGSMARHLTLHLQCQWKHYIKMFSELLLGSLFQPPSHFLCVLFAALPLFQPLLNVNKTMETLIRMQKVTS